MDFTLDKEDALTQKLARDTARKNIAPHASDVDLNRRLPKEALDALWEAGLMNLCIPKEYGGGGRSTFSNLMTLEELGKTCTSTAVISLANTIGYLAIMNYGDKNQKNKYLKRLSSKSYSAVAVTEPDAGSDTISMISSASLKGNMYILNGIKNFVSNGSLADVLIVVATTDRGLGQNGLSAFIVEKDFPGIIIEEDEKLMGLCGAPTTRITFEDCQIPAKNLLGEEGQGYKITMKSADQIRVGLAAISLGLAQAAADIAVKYSRERFQFGKAISSFQAIKTMLADMFADIHQARLSLYHVGWLIDNGVKNFTREAAIVKLVGTDTAMSVANNAVQALGAYGCTRSYPVERMMRDAKILQILGGSSQILKVIISNSLTS